MNVYLVSPVVSSGAGLISTELSSKIVTQCDRLPRSSICVLSRWGRAHQLSFVFFQAELGETYQLNQNHKPKVLDP